MRALTLIFLLLVRAGPLSAHEGEAHPTAIIWTFDGWIIGPLLLAAGLFSTGFFRLRRRSGTRRWMARSAFAFSGGWLVLVAALVSPIHSMGEHLFTFHMIEHEMVMAVAAPLIVLARPVGILLWSMPRMVRRRLAAVMTDRRVRASWNVLAGGAVATSLHGLAIWSWHAPALFDATVSNVPLHRIQHLFFFLTAILFWWAVFWRADRGLAAWHLFVTMMHTSILGALIALAPQVIYVAQTRDARPFSRTGLILVAVLSAALATGIAVAIVKNVSQRGAVATAMTGGDARLAPGIFRRYGCTGCHAIPGVAGADGKVGGELRSLRQRVYIGDGLNNTPDNLIRWIVSPTHFSRQSAMPATGITEAEARHVAAYLYAH